MKTRHVTRGRFTEKVLSLLDNFHICRKQLSASDKYTDNLRNLQGARVSNHKDNNRTFIHSKKLHKLFNMVIKYSISSLDRLVVSLHIQLHLSINYHKLQHSGRSCTYFSMCRSSFFSKIVVVSNHTDCTSQLTMIHSKSELKFRQRSL